MRIVIGLVLNALAVLISSYILPGVHVDGFLTAIIVAIVLAIVNAFLKPIFIIITLPLTILTLGLFIFVINALLILLVSSIIPGFKVDGFIWALLFSLVLAIINSLIDALIKE